MLTDNTLEKHKALSNLVMRYVDRYKIGAPDHIFMKSDNTFRHYNYTHLIEEVYSIVKNVPLNRSTGKDLADGSDVKTGICICGTTKGRACISNIKNKTGDLHVVVYNNHTCKLDYFTFPNEIYKKIMKEYDKNSTISSSYDMYTDNYEYMWELHRFKSIEESVT